MLGRPRVELGCSRSRIHLLARRAERTKQSDLEGSSGYQQRRILMLIKREEWCKVFPRLVRTVTIRVHQTVSLIHSNDVAPTVGAWRNVLT